MRDGQGVHAAGDGRLQRGGVALPGEGDDAFDHREQVVGPVVDLPRQQAHPLLGALAVGDVDDHADGARIAAFGVFLDFRAHQEPVLVARTAFALDLELVGAPAQLQGRKRRVLKPRELAGHPGLELLPGRDRVHVEAEQAVQRRIGREVAVLVHLPDRHAAGVERDPQPRVGDEGRGRPAVQSRGRNGGGRPAGRLVAVSIFGPGGSTRGHR